MNTDLYDTFSKLSDTELINIYNNNSKEYRKEVLLAIEKILEERNIEFKRIEWSDNTTKTIQSEKEKVVYPFDKKLFIKLVLVFIVIGAVALFGKITQFEGKLFSDDALMMFLYKTYVVLAVPLAFIAEYLNIKAAIFFAYIVNLFLWTRLFTYLITRFRAI
jgi:hypothetical protein